LQSLVARGGYAMVHMHIMLPHIIMQGMPDFIMDIICSQH
jgi:hypothetical protein